jgi:glycosyltransferase involved in cell wall biosynthesis
VDTPVAPKGNSINPLDGFNLHNLPLAKITAILEVGFDSSYYTSHYNDVDYRLIDPIEHYCRSGWQEGRNPSRWFSTTGYLFANPDIASSCINPLLHYLVFGRKEGRRAPRPDEEGPNEGSFKSTTETTDSLSLEMALLGDHFDLNFYIDRYPDMRTPSNEPLVHYCVFGWKEGRDPCPWFSTRLYLQHNKDVDNSGINPFYHYIRSGRAEGRPVWPSGYSGPRDLILDDQAALVKDEALRDLIRFPSQAARLPRQTYSPQQLTIDWVVPEFTAGSGGHMTLFRIIRWLELFGHTCRVWVSNLSMHTSVVEFYDDILKHFQTLRAEVRLADDGLADASGDLLVATGWQTVARVMNATGFRERCYLVQDLEFSFYSAGSHYCAAEWTYTQDLACICASSWLADTLSARFGRWTRHFALAYDPEHYHLDQRVAKTAGAPHIAVYGRITTPRRCVEMVLLALEHLAASGVLFIADLFGANIEAHKASFPCTVHGVLDAGDLGELYRRSTLGVCLSTTNYSLVPQEMMACGLPVLEIDGPSTQTIFPSGVVTRSEPHPLSISAAIKELLESPSRRDDQATAAHKWIDGLSWEKSARIVERACLDRLAHRGHQARPIRNRIKKKPTLHASVCIPTFNGGDRLASVIRRVSTQRCPWNFEIIIVDSSSSDGSIECLTNCDRLTVEVISKKDFQHGRTRNRCVELARGAFVAFLTQDACPTDEFWLYNLVSTLEHFPRGAGAFGRHRAWPGASLFTKRDIDSHFGRFEGHPLAVSRQTDVDKWASGDEHWRQMLHYFSDNNSCLRRSVWADYPFPEVDFGEDQIWANRIIEAGFERVYAPSAVVYHSHEFTLKELEERTETESRFFKSHFGYDCYNFGSSFDQQLRVQNSEDERWAKTRDIDKQALERRLRENEARLRGARKGSLAVLKGFGSPQKRVGEK